MAYPGSTSRPSPCWKTEEIPPELEPPDPDTPEIPVEEIIDPPETFADYLTSQIIYRRGTESGRYDVYLRITHISGKKQERITGAWQVYTLA